MPHSSVISVSSSASPMPLLAGETIIFRTRPAFIIPLSFILLLWAVGGLFLWLLVRFGTLELIPFVSALTAEIIYLAVFFLVGLIIFLSWLNTEYILTSKRVEWRFGIIGKGTVSIALEKIQNIVLTVSIIGRIFNFGNLKIEPAGIISSIKFGGIGDPQTRKEQIEDAA